MRQKNLGLSISFENNLVLVNMTWGRPGNTKRCRTRPGKTKRRHTSQNLGLRNAPPKKSGAEGVKCLLFFFYEKKSPLI